MIRKHLFWAVPLVLVLAVLAALLALPSFVAAPAHRAAVEAFASRLTGREVHISGKLSLSYWPQPEIIATGITITGPDHETITAKALSLDLALAPLLHGQLAVRTLDLNTPSISFPWPMPGGISAVAPPPWLAALHAHINNGLVRFGTVDFTGVNADLFTGAYGSVSVSGDGKLAGHKITLGLSVGETADDGSAQLSIHTALDGAKADLSGTLDSRSLLDGLLKLQLPGGITGTAQIQADANSITAPTLNFALGQGRLDGNAKLTFAPLGFNANLTGHGLNFSHFNGAETIWPRALPTRIQLNADQLMLAGKPFPALQATLETGPKGTSINGLNIALYGGASLGGTLKLTPEDGLSGHLSLAAPDLNALAAGLGLPAESAWRAAFLQADLGGSRDSPVLKSITGTLGADHVNGQLRLSGNHAAFQLGFDHLDLTPLATWLGQKPLAGLLTVDGELTAAHAEAGPVKLSNLFVDAALDGTLNIRRATADLYGGIAGGSVTLDKDFKVTSAHAFLDLPSAAPLAALLPAGIKLPPDLLKPHFSLVMAAAGPPTALTASAVARLGHFTFTAAPVINLVQQSARGAVSLRHPNTIEALQLLGVEKGCSRMAPLPGYPFQGVKLPCIAEADTPALAFPGPGALSLRARFTYTPDQYGLNDFVLSAGLLNASGQFMVHKGRLSGQINAGTLALPSLPANLQMPDSLPVSGSVALSADHVLYAGTQIFGPAAGILSLAPDQASFKLTQASIGNGNLTGSMSLKFSAKAPPALSAKFLAEGVDASKLNLPQSFPLTLSSGQISATASLTASGYTAKAWEATLGGSATITASNGTLNGLSLPGIVTALGEAKHMPFSKLLTSGATPFTTLTLAGNFAQGNCSLTQAQLTAPSGSVTAKGGIDLFDATLALRLDAKPNVKPPLTLTTRLIGAWAKPNRSSDSSAAYDWKPAP
ncbi:AsmA family protein [Acidocella aminolytica]|uniref:AsmA family protein n=1 Tax=Acidocella aminolytica TaxID=33998 RepID=UPI0006628214|nr:AsmA family protein [Acidocella aminolytica]SHE91030.1 AsmA-like C-terminal region [Acidocella aminolytica 101 = DSM 11237]